MYECGKIDIKIRVGVVAERRGMYFQSRVDLWSHLKLININYNW